MKTLFGEERILQRLRCHAVPIRGSRGDLEGLLESCRDAEIVVLGTPSPGMREPNDLRMQITRRLIAERGFNAVAVDGDWMEVRKFDHCARDDSAVDALDAYEWSHAGVGLLASWLKKFNRTRTDGGIGVYGLDCFGLERSMSEIVDFLGGKDVNLAARVVKLYSAIDRFGRGPQNYGLLSGVVLADGVRSELVQHLADKWIMAASLMGQDGMGRADEGFISECYGRIQREACQYFRAMFRSYASSWNHRCEAMMKTLEALAGHLQESRRAVRIVVWAHNSLAGDARATELSWRGETSLGALARERYGDRCVLVGVTSHAGRVLASREWGSEPVSQKVISAPQGSCERLFHGLGMPSFWVDFRRDRTVSEIMAKPRMQRAISAVYRPDHSTRRNWFDASCSAQFDALIHCDQTSPVSDSLIHARKCMPDCRTR